MPKSTQTKISPRERRRHLATVLILLALVLAPAAPAGAKSVFETIAENLAARKAAANTPLAPSANTPLGSLANTPKTGTAAITLTTGTAAKGMPMMATVRPNLIEVPNEAGTTSAGQGRKIGSAALTLLKMTSGTAAADPLSLAQNGDAGQGIKAINLGRESDEDEALLATNLFKNKDMRRLLGVETRFIYNPAERPDPMIVPWVRRAAIYKELSAQADAFTVAGQYDKAVEIYQRVLQLDDPRYNAEVHSKLTVIAEKQNAKAIAVMQASRPAEERVDLPPWIHDNTTGVIVWPGREMCLVGEYMLRIGDKVPNYPDVKVATITKRKVVYQIKNRSFEVVLNDN